MNKTNDTFKYHILRTLQRQGFRVHPIWNDNQRCPFDLISVNPKGKVAGIKLKAHGHLSKKEREELLWYDMHMFVASEKYDGGSSEVHAVKLEKIK